MLMGYREYAKHRGCSLAAVQKAVATGRITPTDDKKIDAVAADASWKRNTDSSRVALTIAKPAAKATADPDDVADEATAVDPEDAATTSYRKSRADREHYQALTQELEYKLLVGQLIPVDEAKRIACTAFRSIRDSIMNVSARLKDIVAVESDPHKCEQLIEAELAAALAGIDVARLLKDEDS